MVKKLEPEQCLMHTPPCIRVNGRWERPDTAHCHMSESGYHVWGRRRDRRECAECGATDFTSGHRDS